MPEVDDVGVHAAEGFFELLAGALGGGVSAFGHEEDVVAVAGGEEFSEAFFAEALVVGVGVVEEADAAFEGGFDDLLGFFFGFGFADVEAAESEAGDGFAGVGEGAGGEYFAESITGFGGAAGEGGGEGGGGEGEVLEEGSAVHGAGYLSISLGF